jgi:16S rRNA (guanine527-N7)-methyltransferase
LNAEALDAICSPLALTPTETQREALCAFLELLQRWSAIYNLTAVREPAAMLTQHLADCLAVIEPLRHMRERGRLLDVGSGGGLPGVVIAIMLPLVDVTCVDAVGKKAAFVRQVAGVMRLPNLQAVHARVERMRDGPFDIVTSRAFASLLDFTASTRSRLAEDGVWMAMKGRTPDAEIAALPVDIDVFHVEQLTVPGLDAKRCLVWMRRSPER